MGLLQTVVDARNKILLYASAGVGIVIATTVALDIFVLSALRVEAPDGDVRLEITTRGSLGTGSGADRFGSIGDCLKSQGSGQILDWGSCGSGSSYFAGQGLTLNASNFFLLNAAHSGTTIEATTLLSGATVSATNLLTSSGQLIVEGVTRLNDEVVFGSGIIINGVTYRFPASDGSASGKVLHTDGAGNLSWSTDDSGAGTTSPAQGLTSPAAGFLALAAIHSGTTIEAVTLLSGATVSATTLLTSSGTLIVEGASTLHGATVLNSTLVVAGLSTFNASIQGITAQFSGTVSGHTLRSTTNLSSSGVLAVEGAGYVHGTLSGNTIIGFNLTDCDGDSQTLAWDASTNRFECGDDDNSGGSTSPAQGLTSPAAGFLALANSFSGTALEIMGTASGRHLRAQDLLASSGALIVEGNATFASMTSGSVLFTGANGLLSQTNTKFKYYTTSDYLHLADDGESGINSLLDIYQADPGAAEDYGAIRIHGANGTLASPTNLTANRAIGGLVFRGYEATTGFVNAVKIVAYADNAAWTSVGNVDSYLKFYGVTNNADVLMATFSPAEGATFGDGAPVGTGVMGLSKSSGDTFMAFNTDLGSDMSFGLNAGGDALEIAAGAFLNSPFVTFTSGTLMRLGNITSATGKLFIRNSDASIPGLVVGNAASQTAHAIRTIDSSTAVQWAVTASGGMIGNEQGKPEGYLRWESDVRTHMFFIDADNDAIGINKALPLTTLDIVGGMSGSALKITGASEFIGTASGRHLYAKDLLASSGALIIEGTATLSGGAGYVNAAVCYLANGALGHCTTSDASSCTCVAN